MASSHEVKCINKSDRFNPHERILYIGGLNESGTRWKMSVPDAIAAIEAGTYNFYVQKGGHTVWLIIAKSAHGNKYLKTQNDGDSPDNLLSLPECP